MSYDNTGKSSRSIKCLQFELWQDCDNCCEWCYLKDHRILTTDEQKIHNIQEVIKDINSDSLKDFNAIGLIGGEFFQGQLTNLAVKAEFLKMIELINQKLISEEIREFWLTASLIKPNQLDLVDILKIFDFSKYKNNQRVILCTSFDTMGRFHTEEAKQTWINNLQAISVFFPEITLHTQTILTQDLIEKTIADPHIFDEILKYSMLDFKIPNYFRDKELAINGIKNYHELLQNNLHKFPSKFFIENRKVFLQFLPIYIKIFGKDKLKNLINYPSLRSHTLKIFSEDYTLSNRWDYGEDRYLSCGHLLDGQCYIDSDKCMYCDIEKFIEASEN